MQETSNNDLVLLLLTRLNSLADSVGQLATNIVSISSKSENTHFLVSGVIQKVDDLVRRVDALQIEIVSNKATVVGRKQGKDETVAKFSAVPRFFKEYWPFFLGFTLGISGVLTALFGILR